MIRAKFTCTEITKRKHWDSSKGFLYGAKMMPVTGISEENKKFFEATPSGNIELSTIKENLFEAGAEYYVDFSKAN